MIIKAAEIERKHPGTARTVGAALANYVTPNSIVDFKGFINVNNSAIDEFVRVFIEKYGKEKFDTLKFINTNDLLDAILKKVRNRRINNAKKHLNVSRWRNIKFSPIVT